MRAGRIRLVTLPSPDVPRAQFDHTVNRSAGNDTIVIFEGEFIEKAFARVRELPTLDAPTLPDQSILEQIVAATSQPPA